MNLSTQNQQSIRQMRNGNFGVFVLLMAFASMAISACGSSGGGSSSTDSTLSSGLGVACATGQVDTVSGCETANTVSGTYIGSMSSINESEFGLMLKYMGYCNQYSLVNIGSASCSTYDSRAYVIFQFSSSGAAQAELYAGSSSPYDNSNETIPIAFNGTLSPINNSTGYVMQSGSGLQLYIDTATLSGSSIPAHVVYQGTTIGTLTLAISQ